MEKIRHLAFRILISKWTIPIALFLFGMFFNYALAAAKYYPLECSQQYSGYCNEGNDCYDEFGDDGINYLDFCFNAPDSPHDFADELTGIEVLSDQIEMILSGNVFLYNIVGFWLPFSVIMNFCMTILIFILYKFGYFRKN